MDMRLFRITVMFMGPFAVTCPRMAMPGAITAVPGMVIIARVIMAAATENPGARNGRTHSALFLLK
jgi:hypothetical protein